VTVIAKPAPGAPTQDSRQSARKWSRRARLLLDMIEPRFNLRNVDLRLGLDDLHREWPRPTGRDQCANDKGLYLIANHDGQKSEACELTPRQPNASRKADG
jgi:hypothetical protein